jgi:hypothetical protein
MAGIMPQPQGAPPAQADPGAAPDDARVADDAGDEQASPEEQKEYDGFVTAAMEIIYGGGKVKPEILKLLDDDPADLKAALGDSEEFAKFGPSVALAGAAVVVVLELVKKADGDVSDAVILHGGKEILEELGHVATEAGVHDFSEDELNKAFYIALDLYRETATAQGLLDPSQLKEEFGQIKDADAQGAFTGGGAGQDSDQAEEAQEPVQEPAAAEGEEQDELRG